MQTEYTYVGTGKSITLYVYGSTYTADLGHPNYKVIISHIKEGIVSPEHTEKLIDLFDTKKAVIEYLNGTFDKATTKISNHKDIIKISDSGILTYRGAVLENVLVDKILGMMEEGFDVTPMLNFLINLQGNPSKYAREELMLFMEANAMPLTPDGYLLAYKSVNKDYKDIHSRTFDNSVGSICEMPRAKVNDNRSQTCSAGLHFAAKEYASGFGGSTCKLMILKINPADVVSIPSDYNNQKGRCCKYKVVDEVKNQLKDKNKYDTSTVSDVPKGK